MLYTDINSKLTESLNIRSETTKSEENLCVLGLAMVFFYIVSKTQVIKAKYRRYIASHLQRKYRK